MSSSAKPKPTKNVKNTTPINQQIDELKSLIDWFHSDEFDLDQAAEKYQSAITLAKSIEHDLTSLKNQVNIIAEDFSSK